ncbi:hypothetical protein [Celeribacter sp.]|uniref:ADP-ribosyltransferase-containing protein n=1 Tax=Celeribacter sp. TaxID=1890673 RepID=UPI003A918B7D
MTLFEANKSVAGPVGTIPEPVTPDTPDFIRETVPAAFRLENTIGASSQERFKPQRDKSSRLVIDQEYDPFGNIDGYEDFSTSFAFANSDDEVAEIKRIIDREQKDRETVASAGLPGMAASFGAGILDPINLVPVGGQAYRAYSMGGSILKGGLSTARAGFLGATAAESVLYNSQETRSLGEAASNVAVATFLSGILGGAAGSFRRSVDRIPGQVADVRQTARAASDIEAPVARVEEIFARDADGVAARQIDEQITAPRGEVELAAADGAPVRVRWDNDAGRVASDDVNSAPSVMREYAPRQADNGDLTWTVERAAADTGEVRAVRYALSENEDGAQVLEVSVSDAADFSPKRAAQPDATEPATVASAAQFAAKSDTISAGVDADLTVPNYADVDPIRPHTVEVKADELAADAGETVLTSDDLPRVRRPEAVVAKDIKNSVEQYSLNRNSGDITQAAPFRRWFGDSNVVDKNGDPLIVYHGSETAELNSPEFQFSADKIGSANDIGYFGKGFYFTPHEYEAKSYAEFGGGKGQVGKFYLKIENPLVLHGYEKRFTDNTLNKLKELGVDISAARSIDMDIESAAKKSGYDGIIMLETTAGAIDASLHPDARFDELSEIGESAFKEKYSELKHPPEIIKDSNGDIEKIVISDENVEWPDYIVVSDEYNTEIIAFQPEQIKSVNNPGSFKSTDAGETVLTSDDLTDIQRPTAGQGGSVGAAASTRNNAEEKLKSALGMEKAVRFQDPMLRTATSQSIATRRIVQELAETPLTYEKNALGVATPLAAETEIKMSQAGLYNAMKETDDLFVAYRKGRARRVGDLARIGAGDLVGRNEGQLDRVKFNEEIGRAMRRADQHNIPEVAKAAKVWRDKVFDPLKQDAIDLRLLPEGVDVETAAGYLNRVYNSEKIAARRGEFTSIVARWLKSQQSKEGWEDAEIFDLADEITDRVLGTPDGRLPYDAYLSRDSNPIPQSRAKREVRGPLKGRVFMIPDEMIEDFLESDINVVGRIYTRTMSADVALTRRFESAEMEAPLGEVRRDYANKIAAAKTDAERTKLSKARDADIRDLAAIRDRLRGTYALPRDPNSVLVRAGRVVRSLNYLRLLGGMTLSALPDIARPVMVHGFGRVMGDGLGPMMRNFKAYQLAADEVKQAGTALDMVLDSRSMAIADVTDDFGRYSKFERGVRYAADQFGVVSLMAPWNAATKQFAGVVTMSRALDGIDKWTKGIADTATVENLARAGIDEDMARRIGAQFAAHGDDADGVKLANTANWDDRGAVQAFRGMIVKDVDRIIVTPGQDKPLWMSTELGAVIGQFKSFSIASTQRVFLAGLQQRDAAFLSGMGMMVGLGMLSYYLKAKTAGYEPTDNPGTWLAEGIDRSGSLGWFFEVNNLTEKLTRGTVGVSALTGGPIMSRYASRNVIGALIGPTSGAISDAAQAIGALSAGDWRESDTSAMRRLLPYQNLFYMRQLLDQAERGINSELGVAR